MSKGTNSEKESRQRKRVKQLTLARLLPNMLTTIGMCAGLTGIRFALEGEWEKAVFAILVAAAFDTIDGLSARLFGSSSRFGAELDSFADVISFGVAPAVVIYLWIRQNMTGTETAYLLGWYWIPVLAFTICNVLRLARFNVMQGDESDEGPQDKSYLVGVPAPGGAGLASMPLGLEFILHRFEVGVNISDYPLWVLLWTVLASVLMISRIPTFSFRNMRFRVPQHQAVIVLLVTSLCVAVFLKEPWIFLFSLGVIYVCSIPVSILAHRIDNRKALRSDS
tara:strand:- start:201 stop:1040 length:840 start_codon:yes stop_codon:yes gene_type:complete